MGVDDQRGKAYEEVDGEGGEEIVQCTAWNGVVVRLDLVFVEEGGFVGEIHEEEQAAIGVVSYGGGDSEDVYN